MWIIVLTISLQYGLTIDKTIEEQPKVQYTTQESCEKRARAMTGPLPIPPGYNAKWQYASCRKL